MSNSDIPRAPRTVEIRVDGDADYDKPSLMTVGENGFLWDTNHADQLREHSSVPRRCRHCGSIMRWTGKSALKCTASCDLESFDEEFELDLETLLAEDEATAEELSYDLVQEILISLNLVDFDRPGEDAIEYVVVFEPDEDDLTFDFDLGLFDEEDEDA